MINYRFVASVLSANYAHAACPLKECQHDNHNGPSWAKPAKLTSTMAAISAPLVEPRTPNPQDQCVFVGTDTHSSCCKVHAGRM